MLMHSSVRLRDAGALHGAAPQLRPSWAWLWLRAGSWPLAAAMGEGLATRAGGSAELAIRRTDRMDSGTSAKPLSHTLRADWRACCCRRLQGPGF